MISFNSSGSFKNSQSWLAKLKAGGHFSELDRYGRQGVAALAAATPKESGETANAWTYRVFKKNGKAGVAWYNTHIVNGVSIAIILQYGHGTGTGGYVPGRNYINPAIQPIMDAMGDDVWKKVTT